MNVEEILTKQGISFTHKGKDLVVRCLDPEHDDSKPSMRIDRTLGIFSCPACKFFPRIALDTKEHGVS